MSKKKSTSKIVDATSVNDRSAATKTSVKVDLKDYAKHSPFSFRKENYRLLLIGLAINVLGFLLMIGGATEDPNQFDADSLFSPVRITISPMLIVLGYIIILYSIMRRPKQSSGE